MLENIHGSVKSKCVHVNLQANASLEMCSDFQLMQTINDIDSCLEAITSKSYSIALMQCCTCMLE